MANFTSTAKVKTFLDISGSGDDANLTAIVPAVSLVIESYCRRAGVMFQNGEDVTEYPRIDGVAATKLFLRRYPHAEVTSIHQSEDLPRVYDSTTVLTADEDYIVDDALGIVYRVDGSFWSTEPRAVRVVYDGGYTASGDDVYPSELELAANMICAAVLQKAKTRSYHATSFDVGDGGVGGIRFDDIPMSAREILDRYREAQL
jgi:hypothetical protein